MALILLVMSTQGRRMETQEYRLKSATMDVLTEMYELQDMSSYLEKYLNIHDHEEFLEWAGELIVKQLAMDIESGNINPIEIMHTAFMQGFLFGAKYQERWGSKK